MRRGPSTAELAGPVGVGVRVEVARGSRIIATGLPVADVQLDVQTDRVVPSQLTYTLPASWEPVGAYDPANNFGQRSHVVAVLDCDGAPYEVDLGWYVHTAWEPTSDGVQVTAMDLLQVADEDPLPWPASPPQGATLRTEFTRLLKLPVILDGGLADVRVARETQYGESRTEAVADLAAALSVGYGVRADGYVHVWPITGAAGRPIATYSGRDLLQDAPRRSQERRPNRVVVVGVYSSGDDESRHSSAVTATEPPLEPSAYGWVTERVELSSDLPDSDAGVAETVARVAQERLRMRLISTRSRSLEIVADPRLEAGDVITVATDAGEMITGRITAYSLPVGQPGGLMRVDVEELHW